ncbi:MAG: hypothetical protein JWO08_852, partial [Verrucomicrobiaceae bacterium]|nr:hypothetical protein [Verrucomicrobiaceae bacterium]
MNRYLYTALVVLTGVLVTAGQNAKVIRPDLEVAPNNYIARNTGNKVTIKGNVNALGLPLRRVLLGVGSGLDGFQSVAISGDGRIEVVSRAVPLRYEKILAHISPAQAADFLKSPACSHARRLRGSYTLEGIADGTQAFACLDGSSASSFTWMNNSFPEDFQELWTEARELAMGVTRGWT